MIERGLKNAMRVASKTVCLVIVLAGAASVRGQWLNYPAAGTPRTPDGKANLAGPVPHAANGMPDLGGVWQVEATAAAELTRLFGPALTGLSVPGDEGAAFSKYLVNILVDFKPEETPLRQEFAEVLRQRRGIDTTLSRCLPIGVPADDLLPGPFKIIQTPGVIVVRNEYENTVRQIYTDGRKAPADPEPLWLGYSVGKWEADTLIVDTLGFNDKTWLDGMGHPHSEALHVMERFHRRDFGHMDVQVTVDDPKVYTKPFSIQFTERLIPDSDIIEYFCNENEKDQSHLKSH